MEVPGTEDRSCYMAHFNEARIGYPTLMLH